ncbi:MAG: hypothetical protein ACR2JB_03590 [Bryobacteraceae bacterium]
MSPEHPYNFNARRVNLLEPSPHLTVLLKNTHLTYSASSLYIIRRECCPFVESYSLAELDIDQKYPGILETPNGSLQDIQN